MIRDLNSLGFLFESLVVRDLRVYAQPHDGEVQHYRDVIVGNGYGYIRSDGVQVVPIGCLGP